MFKKHLMIVALILVVAALVAGCAAPAAPAQPTAAPAAAEPTKAPEAPAAKPVEGAFKMGLLLPGSANDQGWNTMAYNALKQVEKDLGAEVSYVELKQDPASYEKAFRDFAAQGYQLVMGHGNEFEDAAKAAAVDYPNVHFFISSSRLSEPTVTGLNTASDQPLYLMGVIAAKMCKAAGFVGGMEIPPISEALTGFINGAKSVDPNFKVYSTYIGNFDDAAAAKEAALGMIAQGADCIVPDADAAGQGVYQAVVEKKDAGVKTFGVFVPATDAAPGQVLANYVSNYGQGVTNLAKQVKEGTYKGGKNVAFGFDMPDVIMLNYDETATTPVPADVRAAAEAAKKQIVEGKIDTLAAESAAPAPAAGAFKMGLLLPGSANDQGWNTMAYNALKQVEKDLGAEVSYVELKQDPASYEKAFRDFAAQGYQLVMGHGNEFEDAAKAAAVDYPNVHFFISSSRLSEPTVTGLNTASDQPLYLMGVIAAKMCKAAGFVGGMEIPPISEALTGFINGAKSVDPNFKVYSTYIGNFDDAAAAKEAALGMIAQGADCIVPDADAAGQGVYQAVVEKKDAGRQDLRRVRAGDGCGAGPGVGELRLELRPGRDQPGEAGQGRHVQGRQERGVRLRHARRDHAELR